MDTMKSHSSPEKPAWAWMLKFPKIVSKGILNITSEANSVRESAMQQGS